MVAQTTRCAPREARKAHGNAKMVPKKREQHGIMGRGESKDEGLREPFVPNARSYSHNSSSSELAAKPRTDDCPEEDHTPLSDTWEDAEAMMIRTRFRAAATRNKQLPLFEIVELV